MRVFAIAFLFSAAVAAPASGEEPANDSGVAEASFNRGVAHYRAKKYEEAIAEFREAHRAAPKAEYLFAWAQAERLSGDCPSAIPLYEKLLRDEPDGRERERIESGLESCRTALGIDARAGTVSEPDAQPAESAPESSRSPVASTTGNDLEASTSTSTAERRRAWYSDPVGWTLVGAGVAGLGAAGAFALSARSARTDAENAADEGVFAEKYDSFQSKRRISIITAAAGGALLTSAVVYWFVREQPVEERRVVGWIGAESAGLGLLGSF